MEDPKAPKAPPSGEPAETPIDEAVLDWIVGGAGADAHGCPACPHSAFSGGMKSGSHILVDGTIFKSGQISGKIGD